MKPNICSSKEDTRMGLSFGFKNLGYNKKKLDRSVS